VNSFVYLGKNPHRAAGERERGDEACGTLRWQGEKCHHGQFLYFTVIGKQVAKKTSLAGTMSKVSRSSLPLRKISHLHIHTTVLMNDERGHNKEKTGAYCALQPNQRYDKVCQASENLQIIIKWEKFVSTVRTRDNG
jgi:hypothetical protein